MLDQTIVQKAMASDISAKAKATLNQMKLAQAASTGNLLTKEVFIPESMEESLPLHNPPLITDEINFQLHYAVNRIINPGKDAQSFRAAAFDNEWPVDKNDIKEALKTLYGKPATYRNSTHLLHLLSGDLPVFDTDAEIIDYLKAALDGKAHVGKKRIARWREEGDLSIKVLNHLYSWKIKIEAGKV